MNKYEIHVREVTTRVYVIDADCLEDAIHDWVDDHRSFPYTAYESNTEIISAHKQETGQ